ncbi:Uncharacterised protein [Kluyvera cryocrescens]|uniref:Uncharacterized protein n=1 Tax=Kluyvera cryocrescens TaxID=580 RepID=A0A485D0I2_KLUCR|nr:Uncharacterised protein [Kluyvera cryocrescens]
MPSRWWLPSLDCAPFLPSICSRTASRLTVSRARSRKKPFARWLDKVLPREEELKAQQALALIQEGNHADALPLLKERLAAFRSG